MKLLHAASALAVVLTVLPVQADILYMRDGKKQMGLIQGEKPEASTVAIRTASGTLAIPRAKIDRIEQEPKAVGFMRVGDQFLDAGKHKLAAEEYRRGLELEPQNAELAGRLRQAEGAVEEEKAAAKQQALARIDEQIVEVRRLEKEKKFEEAQKLLKSLDPGQDITKQAALKNAWAELFYLWGVDRLDRQDPTGAAEKLQMCLKFDLQNESARQMLARVYESDPTKVDEVIAHYKNATAPEDLAKLADALFRKKDYEAALPVYGKLMQDPALVTDLMKQRVRLIYDMLHRQYAERGDFVRARDAYMAFLQYSPGEDPSPLARYEYMVRASQTNTADPKARAELARFAQEQGLIETANQEYRNILQIDPNNQVAKDGLKTYAQADMQDAQALFNEGQYLLAKHKAREIAQKYPMFPEFAELARQLDAKCDVEQQKAQRTSQQQAIALAARGDDYYNQAMAYLSAMSSTDFSRTQRVFTPRIEATKYMQRALLAWQQALQLDPSMGAPTSYDLNRKIADAYAKYATLANPLPPRLPTRDLDRMKRGQDSTGAK